MRIGVPEYKFEKFQRPSFLYCTHKTANAIMYKYFTLKISRQSSRALAFIILNIISIGNIIVPICAAAA